MKKVSIRFVLLLLCTAFAGITAINAQSIPLDTSHWDIQARAYVIENYKGTPAIYLQGGAMTLKEVEFLNGTIEFDIFLKKEQAFPGVYFRGQEEEGNAEHFYLRPHQSGNPDANQAIPRVQGISPWQLYFGPRYSFPYDYHYDDWTHVKILVAGDRAQVFLDHASTPHLSWNLFHPTQKGSISFQGGNRSGMHIANVEVNHQKPTLTDFNPIERPAIEGLIQHWQISDMFEEKSLLDLSATESLIADRNWQGHVSVEEGTAANISRVQSRPTAQTGNTVFAKIEIVSDRNQTKLFEFGYSDRVVAILNGNSIYKGTNRWRSRDYRYLGTVGLFDAIYLDLKKGKNTLLMAVSEDFGGWLITGRFSDANGIQITDLR